MRIILILLIVFLLIGVAIDFSIWKQASKRCKNKFWPRLQLISAIALNGLLLVAMCIPNEGGSSNMQLWKMWLLFGWTSIYISKLIAVVFDFLAHIPCFFNKLRLKFLTKLGIILAIALFLLQWWGALFNRFNIQVRPVEVIIDNLPQTFDGFTIAQFSDLHTGTLGNDTTFVANLVNTINSMHPDMIVFTGDIVNSSSEEMLPFIATLSRLSAPFGVHAILGNHDYGDYNQWPSDSAKQANLQLLIDYYNATGINLLLNRSEIIHKDNDSIALIGVENIGEPPFSIYGSLPKAYPTPADSVVKILLSHNPRHWIDSIAENPDVRIPLTMSGHTHAMQIEVAGLSPAALRYKTWGGEYKNSDSDKTLYVNIGSGTIGFPARIGANPEITIFTLRTPNQTSH